MSDFTTLTANSDNDVRDQIIISVRIRRTIIISFTLLVIFLKYLLMLKLSSAIIFLLVFWLLSTFFLSPWLARRKSPKLQRYGHLSYFLFEVMMMVSISYVAGDIRWISPLMFAFTIVYVNFLLKRPDAVIVTAVAALIFSSMVLAEYFGVIPYQSLLGNLMPLPNSLKLISGTLSIIVLFFIMMSYTVGSFSSLLNRRTLEARSAKNELEKTNRRLLDSEIRLAKWNTDLEGIIGQKTTEIAERNVELEILNAVAISLGKSLHLDTILYETLNQVVKIFPISLGEISLLADPEANIAYVVRNNLIIKVLRGPTANRLSGRFIGEVARTNKAVMVDVSRSRPKLKVIGGDADRVSDLAIFPIKSKGKVVGTLAVSSAKGRYLMARDIGLIKAISNMIGSAIENSRLYHRIKKLSDTDGVTGLFNHRFITRRLDSEFKRALRYNHRMSIMMIDVDKLKVINDNYGHLTGDRTLRRISLAIISACRVTDIIGRYGGDEFLVILPETDLKHGSLVAERILRQVSHLEFRNEDRLPIQHRATVSIGMSSYPGTVKSTLDLISAADANLYAAKFAGGNRLAVKELLTEMKELTEDGESFPLGA